MCGTSKTRIDYVGRRFGRLIVTSEAERRKISGSLRRQWHCKCDCGNTLIVSHASLQSGNTKSCGCYRDHVKQTRCLTHGHARKKSGTKSHTYSIWCQMIRRCHREDDQKYYMYGARGISVCERWRENFEIFLADMGEKPEEMSLDRVDNDGGYDPANCRWATRKEQQRNMRTTRWVEYQGRRMSLAEACELSGLNRGKVQGRLKLGWSVERALAA